MKQPDIQIYQSNAITSARYELSAIEKKIVYLLLEKVTEDDRRKNNLKFLIYAKDLGDDSQTKFTNYSHVREATKKLIGRVYELKHKDEQGKTVVTQTSLVSYAQYRFDGQIEIKIAEKMSKFFLQLAQGYTSYSLDYALSLKSIYSQRIFEFLSRFKDTGVWVVTLEELRYMLSLENKYQNYGTFKERVLDTAQKELYDKTNINFTYQEIKKVRKVYQLKFIIDSVLKNEEKKQYYENEVGIEEIKERLGKYDLRDWQIKKILDDVPLKVINQTIYSISIRKANGELKNTGGYTWKLFSTMLKK